MAFRRFRRRFRKFTGRRFSRARTRAPSNGKRWERANIWFEGDLGPVTAADSLFNSAVLLARVANLSDQSTTQGRATTHQIRGLQIGGIVASFGMEPVTSDFDEDLANNAQNNIWCQNALISDRLNVAGDPAALATTNWNRSQQPIASVGVATPSAAAEEWDFPTQIHFRETSLESINMMEFIDTNAGSLHGVNGQRLRMGRRGMINKRLRLYLDDLHGLFWCFSAWSSVNHGGHGNTFRCWLSGTPYWRVVF